MSFLVACLYVVAAVLPYIGARRLWCKASKDADLIRTAKETANREGVSYDQFQKAVEVLVPAIKDGGDSSGRDLWLIGGGLFAGAVASIWSLFL